MIPFPFSKTDGEFFAQGLLFKVKKGLVTNIIIPEGYPLEKLDVSQKRLLDLVINKKRKIPLSELGIGFYKLIGIDVYDDASVITMEKSGPHAGLGLTAGSHSEEKEKIERKSKNQGDDSHADFIMDEPVITMAKSKKSPKTLFYPPEF